jgi:ubiquinol-cytochrome c reductase cytochrome b subunit
MPGWEVHLWGQTIPFNLLIPGVVLPGILFTLMGLYPWIEQRWITKDYNYHHLLDRPRDNPTRTAIGWMSVSFYLVLLLAGGNDILAKTFHISLYWTTWIFRICLIVVPPIAYKVAKRVCLGLLHAEEEERHHGVETGTIKRLPHGEFIEVHAPLPTPDVAVIEPAGEAAPMPDGESREGVLVGARDRLSGFFYTRDLNEADDDRPAH